MSHMMQFETGFLPSGDPMNEELVMMEFPYYEKRKHGYKRV